MALASGAAEGAHLLRVRNLEVVYGDETVVLRGVDLDVPSASTVAVVGPNGAGKTTLVRAVAGLLPATGGRVVAGAVELDGRPATSLPSRALVRRGVCAVLEGRRVFPQLTVEENLRTGLLAAGDRRRWRSTRDGVLDLFPSLRPLLRRSGGALSRTEQQEVAVARALVSSPRLLLLDEATSGLDPLDGSLARLVDALRERGVAALLADQNAAAVLAVADRGYVLEAGEVVRDGPAQTLLADPAVRQAPLATTQPPGSLRVLAPPRRLRWSA